MAKHLYEFLYRGRPEGHPEPPDYHVILADDGLNTFGNPTIAYSPALTPDQAKAQGFDLPSICAAINTGLAAENAALKAENAALKAETAAKKPA
jgi:hypothetical protein